MNEEKCKHDWDYSDECYVCGSVTEFCKKCGAERVCERKGKRKVNCEITT